MKRTYQPLQYLLLFLLSAGIFAQEVEKKPLKLFKDETPLPVKLHLSFKKLKKESNDSTYIPVSFSYKDDQGDWVALDAGIKKRGAFRLENCYFPPIKIKIPKKKAKGTPFRSDRKLKIVLPCQRDKNNNDVIVKEYWAYQLYEILSPYHFRTRLLDVELTEERGKKVITHKLKGLVIEHIDEVAKRYDAKEHRRGVPQEYHDAAASLRHDYFQYMIGNWDFHTQQPHNVKLIYKDNTTIPIPYDFDLCGLVNPKYAFVPDWLNKQTGIEHVTQRVYRGNPRPEGSCTEIRKEFLDKREEVRALAVRMEKHFEDPMLYNKAIDYLDDFYRILNNPKLYDKLILAEAALEEQ